MLYLSFFSPVEIGYSVSVSCLLVLSLSFGKKLCFLKCRTILPQSIQIYTTDTYSEYTSDHIVLQFFKYILT